MSNRGKMYIDKKGILRIVMEDISIHIVRGIDISNMSICGININNKLESIFLGTGNFNDRKNKVVFKEQ